jgi:hypothetical protein
MGLGPRQPRRRSEVPPFDRGFLRSAEPITRIGDGELGGKARGLVRLRDLIAGEPALALAEAEIRVPRMAVVGTAVFDAFLTRNGLHALAAAEPSDAQLTQAFLRAEFPAEAVGDLRALVEDVRRPLAVRSSSLLEDALDRPFAGVYGTKMVPNGQPDADTRFQRLVEAVKFVWASTYFREARSYRRAADLGGAGEKMAVILQEVVGRRHGERFYPDVSGVARSYNFFPAQGDDPRNGVVNLALGLGKTIVDGGTSWIYSPARPQAPPPFGSVRDRLRLTQRDFWAVHLGPAVYDPLSETEYLVRAELDAAEYDGTLERIASTYDPQRDRVVPGTAASGPRVLDFAPLLAPGGSSFNGLVRELLAAGERALGAAVELEFALTFAAREADPGLFGLLQLRPMLVSEDTVEIGDEELAHPDLLLASEQVLGNGALDRIQDVVYVVPETFDTRASRAIAEQLERLDRALVEQGRPYLLAGFGRWGSADPFLGIPVQWGQIAGARAIVESTSPQLDVEPSQGAHFFHNLIAFRVFYFCVRHTELRGAFRRSVDWAWLARQPIVAATEHARHVRLERPLRIKVDGRTGRGAVWRG